jgi:hypothetical protein
MVVDTSCRCFFSSYIHYCTFSRADAEGYEEEEEEKGLNNKNGNVNQLLDRCVA